ncbi:hypothetical protein KGF56_000830 [Candida oxycetoniae]|uniref:Uncharacterized protein n=1 Tax=Candida oxycetoniae TaxID=497107 RepID=A0AAI9T0H7_9ASCO|nr:uncharacterized protein KGF56_000830 [Candida oxycetoniae]KAI3406349.2 hypothetical protein KGF56_000830 [Candida oxycetoniae]
MGFIESGKPSVKKRKVAVYKRKNHVANSTHQSPSTTYSSQDISVTLTLSPCAKSSYERKVCLKDLPFEVIRKIFIFAGPGNNLHLVNRSFYQNMRFSGVNDDQEEDQQLTKYQLINVDLYDSEQEEEKTKKKKKSCIWKNYSLVITFIRRYFLYDLNIGLDEDLIGRKMEFYLHQLDDITSLYPNYNQSEYYQKFVANLEMLASIWNKYKTTAGRYVLNKDLLNFKFISRKLLLKLTSETFCFAKQACEKEELLKFKCMQEIELNRKLRVKFLRFKFRELYVLLDKVKDDLVSGTFESLGQYNEFEKYVEMINNHPPEMNNPVSNPPIPMYPNENEEFEGFTIDRTTFYNYKAGYIFGWVFFGELDNFAKECLIPDSIYLKSIKSRRFYNVVLTLDTSVHPLSRYPDFLLQEILYSLHPNNVDFKIFASLSTIVRSIMDGTRFPAAKYFGLIGSLKEAFKLYDTYSKLDYLSFGVNERGLNILENLFQGMHAMFLYTLQSYENEKEDQKQLWALALELKNAELIEFMSRASKILDP